MQHGYEKETQQVIRIDYKRRGWVLMLLTFYTLDSNKGAGLNIR